MLRAAKHLGAQDLVCADDAMMWKVAELIEAGFNLESALHIVMSRYNLLSILSMEMPSAGAAATPVKTTSHLADQQKMEDTIRRLEADLKKSRKPKPAGPPWKRPKAEKMHPEACRRWNSPAGCDGKQLNKTDPRFRDKSCPHPHKCSKCGGRDHLRRLCRQ